MSANKPSTFTINWATGPEETPTEHIYWIIEGVMGCLVGDEEWMVASGHWPAPLFCLNRTTGIHHAFHSWDDLYWSLLHTKEFEGTDDEQQDGDQQFMEALREKHRLLEVLLSPSKGSHNGVADNPALTAVCIQVGLDLKGSANALKRNLLQLMIELVASEEAAAIELVKEMLELDEQRLAEIEQIGIKINRRAAAVAQINIHVRRRMQEIGNEFQRLHNQHLQVVTSTDPTEISRHLREIDMLEANLREIKLPPYNKLVEHDLRDIAEYRELIAKGLFEEAAKRLMAAVVAHEALVTVEHRLRVVRFRLFTARKQRGSKRDASLTKAQIELIGIRDAINLKHARCLRRNAPRSVLGRVYAALLEWRRAEPDFSKIGKILTEAQRAFG